MSSIGSQPTSSTRYCLSQTIKSDRSGDLTNSYSTSPHHLLDPIHIRTQFINNRHPQAKSSWTRIRSPWSTTALALSRAPPLQTFFGDPEAALYSRHHTVPTRVTVCCPFEPLTRNCRGFLHTLQLFDSGSSFREKFQNLDVSRYA